MFSNSNLADLQESLFSPYNKKEIATLIQFIEAVHGGSKVPYALAQDAGLILKLLNAEENAVRTVRSTADALQPKHLVFD